MQNDFASLHLRNVYHQFWQIEVLSEGALRWKALQNSAFIETHYLK
jgi:hypothetical protein